MQKELYKIWEDVLDLLSERVSSSGYQTVISAIKPFQITDDTISLIVNNHFEKQLAETKYKKVIANAITEVSGKNYAVNIVLDNDLSSKQEEDHNDKDRYNNYKTSDVSTNVTNLNVEYTFESFVVGNSNRLAHAAALAVAEGAKKTYNPLFLYGGVGLGKTHLMHAIGNHIANIDKSKKIIYVSSETFTNELIKSIGSNRNDAFRKKYRNIDLLLIDDIQFIAGKERTQEEFFHTFNELYENNKHIILSSDRMPSEIPTLEERLRSRFGCGLTTDIQAPDLETRIAILQKKLALENQTISDDVIYYVATNIKSNIRELEGALNRVMAVSSLNNTPVTIEVAQETLSDILNLHNKEDITVEQIKDLISRKYKLKMSDFSSKSRSRNISYPRQIAMYLTRELTDLSLPKIGEDFGGRDHSTVIHACDKISNDIKNNDLFRSRINSLVDDLRK